MAGRHVVLRLQSYRIPAFSSTQACPIQCRSSQGELDEYNSRCESCLRVWSGPFCRAAAGPAPATRPLEEL